MKRKVAFATLFANRPFLLLWGSQVFSQLGVNLLLYTLAFLILRKTGSNMAVGALMFAFGLPVFLFGIAAGVLVDRVSRKKVLFLANLSRFFIILGFLIPSKSLFLLYLLVFLFASATQFFVPAEGSLLPTLVNRSTLFSANSLFIFTLYSSVILGLTGAGPLLELLGEDKILGLIATLFFFATAFIAFLPKKVSFWQHLRLAIENFIPFTPSWQARTVAQLLAEFREGLAFVRAKAKVLEPLSLLVFSQISIATLLSLVPGFAVSVLKIRVERASIFVGLPAALGMILGALFLGSFGTRFSRKILKSLGIFSVGTLLVILSFVGGGGGVLLWAVAILFLLGVANAAIDVPSQTDLQEGAGRAMRGRVYGILSTLVSAGATFPVLIVGFLADQFGIPPVIFGLGVIAILFGTYHRARFARSDI